MTQKPFIRNDDRHLARPLTPLEKDLGVKPVVHKHPGVYRPDGQLVPISDVQRREFTEILREQLVKAGAKVEIVDGKWRVTPPYPEGCNRQQRRAIDNLWAERITHMFREFERNARRPR